MHGHLQRQQRSTGRGIAHRVACALLVCVIGLGLGAACDTGTVASSRDATDTMSTTTLPPTPTGASSSGSTATLVAATVVRVVDGDTLVVAIQGDEQRVRLIGIDTPELNKPNGPIECFATEAARQTESLIDRANGQIQLERDTSETDQYGRLLRYVWLLSPNGKQMLNEELVEGGFARAITYRPDVKYQSVLNREQSAAKNERLGLWGTCR